MTSFTGLTGRGGDSKNNNKTNELTASVSAGKVDKGHRKYIPRKDQSRENRKVSSRMNGHNLVKGHG